ncbi:prosaposin-like [Triplophysa rosa]|uniref:Antimicrobial peptide NK-lysin-like n=1 Tax=Triplophysa rosa TaxID=992332 RepID=A0A9W7WML2_TRIRA|nr:prosaposin-like [Triplophysa rosa]KAI7804962.1 putative antimicrobial peptide NK-lysin-like [Triplophysa rosa]
MLRNVFLITLLICSACAVHWEIREVASSDDVDEMPADRMTGRKPGVCWVCKWVVKKVKKSISTTSTPDEIKNKLLDACDQSGFLKAQCKSLVSKDSSTLVEEISTSDDPNTICTNLNVCTSKPPPRKDFILSSDRGFYNL